MTVFAPLSEQKTSNIFQQCLANSRAKAKLLLYNLTGNAGFRKFCCVYGLFPSKSHQNSSKIHKIPFYCKVNCVKRLQI